MSELEESHLNEMPAGEEDLFGVNHATADFQSNSDRRYINSLSVKSYQDKTGTDQEPDTCFCQRVEPIWTALRQSAVLCDDTDARQPATRALGPERPLGAWLAPRCSFPRSDIHVLAQRNLDGTVRCAGPFGH